LRSWSKPPGISSIFILTVYMLRDIVLCEDRIRLYKRGNVCAVMLFLFSQLFILLIFLSFFSLIYEYVYVLLNPPTYGSSTFLQINKYIELWYITQSIHRRTIWVFSLCGSYWRPARPGFETNKQNKEMRSSNNLRVYRACCCSAQTVSLCIYFVLTSLPTIIVGSEMAR
jgi:hypothetical protein